MPNENGEAEFVATTDDVTIPEVAEFNAYTDDITGELESPDDITGELESPAEDSTEPGEEGEQS